MLCMALLIGPSKDKPPKVMWYMGPNSPVTIDAQSYVQGDIFGAAVFIVIVFTLFSSILVC